MQAHEPHAMSIHRVRPISGREEALDYLRDMCVYWYEKRPAFPGDPEALYHEFARLLPEDGVRLDALPAPQGSETLELQRMAERVVRLNPGAPGVRELADVLARIASHG